VGDWWQAEYGKYPESVAVESNQAKLSEFKYDLKQLMLSRLRQQQPKYNKYCDARFLLESKFRERTGALGLVSNAQIHVPTEQKNVPMLLGRGASGSSLGQRNRNKKFTTQE